MAPDSHVVLLTFPARAISPDVSQWLALAGDITAAYTADRRSDDPALYRRIVIVDNPHGRPTFLIHQPAGLTMWVKTVVRRKVGLRRSRPFAPRSTRFGTYSTIRRISIVLRMDPRSTSASAGVSQPFGPISLTFASAFIARCSATIAARTASTGDRIKPSRSTATIDRISLFSMEEDQA